MSESMDKSKPRMKATGWMIIMLVLAGVIKILPVVSIPLSYFTTYFHELSHGLMALITGGEIDRIQLRFDGSGVCYYIGGNRFLASFSGYAFTSLFGAIIFMLGVNIHLDCKRNVKYWLSSGILASMIAVGIINIRDFPTLILISGITLAVILSLKFNKYGHLFLKLVGIYMMIDTFYTISYLQHYHDSGDHYTLMKLTGIPMIIWMGIWILISLCTLVMTFMMLRKEDKPES